MPSTRSGASAKTKQKAEPSKAKLEKEARRAWAEQERQKQTLVEQANAKRDVLDDFEAQRELRKHGLNATLEWLSGPALSDDDMVFCAELLAANMKAHYKAAGWGWSDAAKKRALRDEQTRLLMIRSSPKSADADEWVFVEDPERDEATGDEPQAGNLGFVMVQFCIEDDRPVLYLLELQLAEPARGKGLGKALMLLLEQIASKHRMQARAAAPHGTPAHPPIPGPSLTTLHAPRPAIGVHSRMLHVPPTPTTTQRPEHSVTPCARVRVSQCVMLTVFKANEDALGFYKRLQYEIDETSPSQCGVSTSSYEIMSKPLDQPAGGKSGKGVPAKELEASVAPPA